jgi:hypothetical protein
MGGGSERETQCGSEEREESKEGNGESGERRCRMGCKGIKSEGRNEEKKSWRDREEGHGAGEGRGSKRGGRGWRLYREG